jgi:hypothetical protein
LSFNSRYIQWTLYPISSRTHLRHTKIDNTALSIGVDSNSLSPDSHTHTHTHSHTHTHTHTAVWWEGRDPGHVCLSRHGMHTEKHPAMAYWALGSQGHTSTHAHLCYCDNKDLCHNQTHRVLDTRASTNPNLHTITHIHYIHVLVTYIRMYVQALQLVLQSGTFWCLVGLHVILWQVFSIPTHSCTHHSLPFSI